MPDALLLAGGLESSSGLSPRTGHVSKEPQLEQKQNLTASKVGEKNKQNLFSPFSPQVT